MSKSTLTLYKNLDPNQPVSITGRSQEACLAKLRARFKDIHAYDGLCIVADNQPEIAMVYIEGTKDWEINYWLEVYGSDAYDTFGEALDQFIAECRLSDVCWDEV